MTIEDTNIVDIFGVASVGTFILAVLKIFGVDISWWMVLFPIWGLAVFLISVGVAILLLLAITLLLTLILEKLERRH